LYWELQQQLTRHVRDFLKRQYGLDLPRLVVDQPPSVSMGEYALPLSFELAKKLRKPPRKIAEEIVGAIGAIPGFDRLEVAGAGYINARVNRQEAARLLLREDAQKRTESPRAEKILVEHTSINPNKAAHIGHLRNAVLGDTFARLLRYAGHRVEVQNYIDNTGVQVADVVLGFLHVEPKSLDEVRTLAAAPRFDYFCWDLYARVTQFLAEDKSRLELRARTLQQIEEGHGDAAQMAELVATAIVHRHLRTLDRLGIDYDLLTRESEILHLTFWDAAFGMLKQRGAI